MCHLPLLLPVLALALFWFAPPALAIPVFAATVIGSVLLYWVIVRSMRQPLGTMEEKLVGSQGTVVSRLESGRQAQYLVRAGEELWTARCGASLQAGDPVQVWAIKGVSLVVEPWHGGGSAQPPAGKEGCH